MQRPVSLEVSCVLLCCKRRAWAVRRCACPNLPSSLVSPPQGRNEVPVPEPAGMQSVAELQALCQEAQVDPRHPPTQQVQPTPEEDEYIEDADDDFDA